MKVLLIQDVYNLGRAGEIKKVANGYGRNYLLPQGFAVLATPNALLGVERIKEDANKKRAILNEEMGGVAQSMEGMQLEFPARAGETGKLYGSVTTMMIAEALSEKLGVEISKRQIDSQPLRLLGLHMVNIRLTIDLIPEISVVVYREGEAIENYLVPSEELYDVEEGEEIDFTSQVVGEEEIEDMEASKEDAKAAPDEEMVEETVAEATEETMEEEPEAAAEPEDEEETEEEEEFDE
jgi:large subunit ribosomal protein L9